MPPRSSVFNVRIYYYFNVFHAFYIILRSNSNKTHFKFKSIYKLRSLFFFLILIELIKFNFLIEIQALTSYRSVLRYRLTWSFIYLLAQFSVSDY